MTAARSFRLNWRHAVILTAGLVLLASLLSHGTSGGDEDGVLSFVTIYRQGGLHALLTHYSDESFLAHRLFWFSEKLTWTGIVHAVIPGGLVTMPQMETWWLVLDGPLAMVGAFALLWSHLLRRGHHWSVAILAPCAVMVSSSAIGLFTGGFSECLMTLMVAGLAALLDREGRPSPATFTGFVICGAMLVFTKLYAAPFVLLLCFMFQDRAMRRISAGLLAVAPFAWLMLQSKIAGNIAHGGMLYFYMNLVRVFQPWPLLTGVVAYFLSFSFGLVPCFPLLLFAAWTPKPLTRALFLKMAGILGVMAITVPFGFWYGPGGMGGPRYIAPFLVIFVPEIAAAMASLCVSKRGRRALLLVPIMALLFLPAIDYRNSLVTRYSQGRLANEDMDWSHVQPDMHPAVFAWRIVAAKVAGEPVFRPSRGSSLVLPVEDIFPMTGISRIVYVLDHAGDASGPILAAALILKRMHLASEWAWRIAEASLAGLLLALLTLAALRCRPAQ